VNKEVGTCKSYTPYIASWHSLPFSLTVLPQPTPVFLTMIFTITKVPRLCLTRSVYEDDTLYEEEPLILKQQYQRYSIDGRCTHGIRSGDFHLTLARHDCLLKGVVLPRSVRFRHYGI
jgi:hypothetical protein